MNTFKIMSDLLKLVKKNKTHTYRYGILDDYIYLLPDGYRLFKVHKDDFLIDLTKALPKCMPLNYPENLLKDDEYTLAYKTDDLKVIEGPKRTLVKIANRDAHAWVNVDYLKDFDDDCTFKIYGPKNPVFIYENDKKVGLVLPFFVKEDRDDKI